jgi:hypothetical protein
LKHGRRYMTGNFNGIGMPCKMARNPFQLNLCTKTMTHSFVRVIGFNHLGPHTLEVTFDDQTTKVINFTVALSGPLFAPLLDADFFKRVKLDRLVGTLVWPNGADFDPDTLYHWEEAFARNSSL